MTGAASSDEMIAKANADIQARIGYPHVMLGRPSLDFPQKIIDGYRLHSVGIISRHTLSNIIKEWALSAQRGSLDE